MSPGPSPGLATNRSLKSRDTRHGTTTTAVGTAPVGIVCALMSLGVIGLGYVGLPLAVAFVEAGEDVVAVDVDAAKLDAVARGESYVEDISSERLAAVRERITASSDFASLADTEAVLICVPTPLTANREPDLGPLLAAGEALGKVVRRGQLVVLESTTYPGTTREQLVPLLEAGSGLRVGDGLNVAFSPERVDPGRTDYTLRNTPKVIGGITPECLERAKAVYARVCDVLVAVSTPEAAEMTKLLENIFRSVNIALVNELAILADRMGLDIWEVVDAAATKPYGFMPFQPGPGMGGHCLPVDPFYLSWRARSFHMSTEFIELAGKSTTRCRTTASSGSNARSTTSGSQLTAPRSRSSASATKAESVTPANHLRCESWKSSPSAAPNSPTTTPMFPSCSTRPAIHPIGRDRQHQLRRDRARHRPPRYRPHHARRQRTTIHRPPRRHPRHANRQKPGALVATCYSDQVAHFRVDAPAHARAPRVAGTDPAAAPRARCTWPAETPEA